MSVFMIQQNAPKTGNEQEQTIQKPTESTGVEAPEQTGGEQQIVTGAVDSPAVSSVDENGKEKTIKIDGPISRVFTDALNQLLSTESYLTMVPQAIENEKPDDDGDDDNVVQVYCWNANDLNVQDLTKITDEITRHTERNYVISIETAGHVPNIVGLASELGRMPNVVFCSSIAAGVEAVKARICK